MRILIAAIGRARNGPERDLFESYKSRITRQVFADLTLKEVELRKTGHPSEAIEREGALLLSAIPSGATVVALDERGKAFTSRAFASFIEKEREAGLRDLVFVIGGADGLAETVRQRARIMMSFGLATWPHLLVRALLAEQLYRAQTILTGHPYHRD